MNATVSLGVLATVVAGTVAFALFSMRRISMSPQEYIVGGRGFGAVFLWVLLAGEIYTSFTFLGAAGWAYNFGAPAFYILAYGTIAYVIGYFLLPAIWRVGKERGLLTAPDFFVSQFGSTWLGVLVALIQCTAVIPYVTLQLTGLELFLQIAGYGSIDAQTGAILGFLVITGFVFLTGLRGTAWASIVKDALVLGALVFAGVAIPTQFFGSPAGMFDQVLRAHPDHLTLPVTGAHNTVWFVSTVLLTAFGFFMGPHSIAATYSAKDDITLRRNAMFLPIYQVVLALAFFAGFSALLIVPGLKGPETDQSFLLIVQRYYPSWVLGFVVAAGALCALVPSTALLLSSASILAKNVVGDAMGLFTDDRSRVRATRAFVVVIALFALVLWVYAKTTLVELLLLYYNGVTQFMPAFVFGFLWKRTNALGVAAGIIGGIALAVTLAALKIDLYGINVGFAGLALNVALLVVVSLVTQKKEPAALATGS